MSRRRKTTAWLLATLIIPAAGCREAPEASSARAAAPKAAATPPPRVSVSAPVKGTVRKLTEQPGQVEPFEQTSVHAKLAGYVERVAVDIGSRVKAGDELAVLAVPELAAEARQKRALVTQAEADRDQGAAAVAVADAALTSALAKRDEVLAAVHRADADVARWQSEYARTEQLVRESAVTASLRDETRSKLEAARAAREEAGAQVRSAEAAVGEAKAAQVRARADAASAAAHVDVAKAEAERSEALLKYATIRAPFDGVVTRRHVDTGALTEVGASSDPLFVVARVDQVTVSVAVPEAAAPLVGKDDPVRLRFPGLDGRVVEGAVSRTGYAIDAGTRTLRAEVDLPNKDDLLRPGLYVYATIVAAERVGVLTVPATAPVREAGKVFCVVAEGGKARRKPVTLGISDGLRVEVVSGLDAADLVVEKDADALADGQAVEPARTDAPAAEGAKP